MRIRTFVTMACLALAGTITFAQNISVDFDKRAAFARFTTYAWVPGTNLIDQLNHHRIVSAVDAQLAMKGLAKTEQTANPDLLVAYHASFDTNLKISGFGSGWGGYRFAGTRSGTAVAEELLIGTLVVDVVQAKNKHIVWRGMATKEIDPYASADTREKNIQKAAEKLFKNYPPKP